MRFSRGTTVPACLGVVLVVVFNFSVIAQEPAFPGSHGPRAGGTGLLLPAHPDQAVAVNIPRERSYGSGVALYFDPQSGSSFADLAGRSLTGNGELMAARIEIERARARLRQAGLRPNPTLDLEYTTGRLAARPPDRTGRDRTAGNRG